MTILAHIAYTLQLVLISNIFLKFIFKKLIIIITLIIVKHYNQTRKIPFLKRLFKANCSNEPIRGNESDLPSLNDSHNQLSSPEEQEQL